MTTQDEESRPQATLAETHISVVVFVGDRAYKLKKPVTLPFLDFGSREKRLAACRREVELNRRLAPDVYLGVADVGAPDGSVCDHLVVMRRMPEHRRLSTLAAAGTALTAEVRSVARTIAAFHAAAPTSPEISAAAGRDAVARNWRDNAEQMRRFVGPVLDGATEARIEELAFRYLAARGPLFDTRVVAGRARDGHGDLLAGDIFCLDDGPRILDCVEFDDRLRWGDVLADVAFLVMDLERLGRADLAEQLLRDYAEFSGERHPATLADHYVAYRAQVRAKVACLRHEQGDATAAAEARELQAICRRHLERGRVRMVLVGGPPGSGKSTLAAAVGRACGWTVLRTDEVRRDLAGLPRTGSAATGWRQGAYAPPATAATYAELLRRARRLLELGEPVVLDASWADAHRRDEAAEVADQAVADLVELRCEAPPDLAVARAARRAATGDDVSDAGAEVARRLAAEFSPWPASVPVDTAGEPARSLEAALGALADGGELPHPALAEEVAVP